MKNVTENSKFLFLFEFLIFWNIRDSLTYFRSTLIFPKLTAFERCMKILCAI